MGKRPQELDWFNINELARLCRVSVKTATRWKDGTTCPPATALMILARDLGCFADEWRGWTIRGEDLVSPEGWCVNRNDAMVVPLLHGQISALKAKLTALEATDFEDQPQPGALPTILSTA